MPGIYATRSEDTGAPWARVSGADGVALAVQLIAVPCAPAGLLLGLGAMGLLLRRRGVEGRP